jgi:meiotically up-regulated gene 157 (Mug157) protein
MTDKLSKALEQFVDKTMKNLDKMTSTQTPIFENDLDSTIDSLSRMPSETGNPVVKNNSIWMWLENPADQMMVAVMLVLGRSECSKLPCGLVLL